MWRRAQSDVAKGRRLLRRRLFQGMIMQVGGFF
jgi:hypothetical protein